MKLGLQATFTALVALSSFGYGQELKPVDPAKPAPPVGIAPDEAEPTKIQPIDEIDEVDPDAQTRYEALTLDVICETGQCYLQIADGQHGDFAFLVVGAEPTAIDLPWGGQLLARPDLVLWVGEFDADGMATFALPGDTANAGGSDRLALIQAVSLGGVDDGKLTSKTSNVILFESDSGKPPTKSVRAAVKKTAGETGGYELALEMDVDTAGHSLQLHRIERASETGDESTRVYVRHTPPGSGYVPPVRETLKLNVDLGEYGGERIEVWCATGHDGTSLDFEKVAELNGDGSR